MDPNEDSDVAAQQASASFDDVFSSIAGVQGWMTRAQARRLWDRSAALGAGSTIVEIGSFHGRSAIVLASTACEGVAITTIDPHGGNDRGPREIEGFEDEAAQDHQIFLANLERAGVRHRINHLRKFSQHAVGEVDGAIDLLYIDGAHRFVPARADIRRWGPKVPDGGTLMIHDSFSSLGVTLALIVELFVGRRFAYEGRSGSLAEYRRRDLSGTQVVTNLARQVAQLPWFARNLVIKALIVARVGRLTRLLGSDGTWPY